MLSRLHYCAVFFVLMALWSGSVLAASREQLLKRMEMIEKMDHEDFMAGLEEANQCIGQRSFSCADNSLSRIRPLVRSDDDSRLLALVEANLQRARDQVEAEERLRKEEEERLEREERRLIAEAKEEERRQQEAEAAEEKRRAMQYAINGLGIALMAKNMQPEQVNTLLEANARDYKEGGNGRNLQASMSQLRAESERRLQETQQKMRERQAQQRQSQQEAMQKALMERRERDAARQQQVAAAQQQVVMQQRTQDAARQQQQAAAAAKARLERDAFLLAEKKKQEEAEEKKISEQKRLEKERQNELAAEERKRKREEEAAARKKAENDYLQNEAIGSRFKAIQCFGEKHMIGMRPNVKPVIADCMYLTFRFRCQGEQHWVEQETYTNYSGTMGGCFGESYELKPKPSCPVEKIEIEGVRARGCFSKS